jgi:hypothetical protein
MQGFGILPRHLLDWYSEFTLIPYLFVSRGSSVGIATRLRAGRLRIRGSFPRRGKRFFFSP